MKRQSALQLLGNSDRKDENFLLARGSKVAMSAVGKTEAMFFHVPRRTPPAGVIRSVAPRGRGQRVTLEESGKGSARCGRDCLAMEGAYQVFNARGKDLSSYISVSGPTESVESRHRGIVTSTVIRRESQGERCYRVETKAAQTKIRRSARCRNVPPVPNLAAIWWSERFLAD